MDTICVVDASLPPYLGPTTRECFVSVGVSSEAAQLQIDGLQHLVYVGFFVSCGLALLVAPLLLQVLYWITGPGGRCARK